MRSVNNKERKEVMLETVGVSLNDIYAENYTLASRNFRLFDEALLACCFVKEKPECNDYLRPQFPSKAELQLLDEEMRKARASAQLQMDGSATTAGVGVDAGIKNI